MIFACLKLKALLKMGIRGVTVSDVKGFGAQGGSKERQGGKMKSLQVKMCSIPFMHSLWACQHYPLSISLVRFKT